jgi:hypothetical protein
MIASERGHPCNVARSGGDVDDGTPPDRQAPLLLSILERLVLLACLCPSVRVARLQDLVIAGGSAARPQAIWHTSMDTAITIMKGERSSLT